MDKRIKIVIALAVFAVFIIACVLLYNTLSASNAPPSTINPAPASESVDSSPVGEPSPAADEESSEQPEDDRIQSVDFTVFDAEGNQVKLSDFLGKPVVLNFWASWCPPCKVEMPDFDKIHGELGDEVAFMMVDLVDGQQETQETGSAYIAEQGYTFPVYYDNQQQAAYSYGIRSIPTTFFIDAEGYVVTMATGQLYDEALREAIDLIR